MKLMPYEVIWAVRNDSAVMDRFWSLIAKDLSADGCWEWTGAIGPDARPRFFVRNSGVTPLRIAWFVATGELPRAGRMSQRCENARCVRPEHLAWTMSHRTRQTLESCSEGYVAVTGS
jgi:hypothetical protein